jgi:hypothetical protein
MSYEATTQGITVTVVPNFIEDDSASLKRTVILATKHVIAQATCFNLDLTYFFKKFFCIHLKGSNVLRNKVQKASNFELETLNY